MEKDMTEKEILKFMLTLREGLCSIMDEVLEEKGFQLPITLVLVDRNGNLWAIRDEDEAAERELVPFIETDTNIELPFHVMVTDSTGNVLQLTIPEGDEIRWPDSLPSE